MDELRCPVPDGRPPRSAGRRRRLSGTPEHVPPESRADLALDPIERLAEGHWRIAATEQTFGRVLLAHGRATEAAPLLRASGARIVAEFHPSSPRVAAVRDAERKLEERLRR
jgi:hypothetical protein